MKKLLVEAALATSTMSPAALTGHKNDHPLPESLKRKYDRWEPEVKRIDLNDDAIPRQEGTHAGIQSKVDVIDLDKDCVVSPDERSQAISSFREETEDISDKFRNKRVRTVRNRMNSVDANDDGVISAEEYSGYFGERFQRVGKSEDGALNFREFRDDAETAGDKSH